MTFKTLLLWVFIEILSAVTIKYAPINPFDLPFFPFTINELAIDAAYHVCLLRTIQLYYNEKIC